VACGVVEWLLLRGAPAAPTLDLEIRERLARCRALAAQAGQEARPPLHRRARPA
jgi:hypothetical protein